MDCSNCEKALIPDPRARHLACAACGAVHSNPETVHTRPVEKILDSFLVVPVDPAETHSHALARAHAAAEEAERSSSPHRESPRPVGWDSVTTKLDAALGVPPSSSLDLPFPERPFTYDTSGLHFLSRLDGWPWVARMALLSLLGGLLLIALGAGGLLLLA